MNIKVILFITPFLLMVIISCVSTVPQPGKRNDPLINTIIHGPSGRTVDFPSLAEAIASYDVIYLSEKHDNPDHHAIQHKIIEALLLNKEKAGPSPSIGFEFFSTHHTSDLLGFIDRGPEKQSEKIEIMIEKNLRMKLGWHLQSDTLWQYYFDLLLLAREKGLTAAGLDLSAALKKRITRKGAAGLNALEKDQIFSTGLTDPVYKNYMFDIFKAVHCGMGNEKMQARLYDTWVARNDAMAQSIVRMHTHSGGPVIVIIGYGHTEYGLGVINRVAAIDSTIRQVNIGLTEISVTPSLLPEYLEPLDLEGYSKVPRADYLWFTQRVSYEDPCERFKEALKRMKR